jgi:hypothetical protein
LFKKSFPRLKKILPTPLHSALVGNSPSIFGRRRFLGTLSECLFFFRYILVPLRWARKTLVFQFLEADLPSFSFLQYEKKTKAT